MPCGYKEWWKNIKQTSNQKCLETMNQGGWVISLNCTALLVAVMGLKPITVGSWERTRLESWPQPSTYRSQWKHEYLGKKIILWSLLKQYNLTANNAFTFKCLWNMLLWRMYVEKNRISVDWATPISHRVVCVFLNTHAHTRIHMWRGYQGVCVWGSW